MQGGATGFPRVVLTTSPKLDAAASQPALGLLYSSNSSPVQSSFTGSIGRATVTEVLVLSV